MACNADGIWGTQRAKLAITVQPYFWEVGWFQVLAGVAFIGLLAGVEELMILSGYLFIIAAIAAWYTASALMLNEAFGREIWSLGKTAVARQLPPVTMGTGEPGVIRGQV